MSYKITIEQTVNVRTPAGKAWNGTAAPAQPMQESMVRAVAWKLHTIGYQVADNAPAWDSLSAVMREAKLRVARFILGHATAAEVAAMLEDAPADDDPPALVPTRTESVRVYEQVVNDDLDLVAVIMAVNHMRRRLLTVDADALIYEHLTNFVQGRLTAEALKATLRNESLRRHSGTPQTESYLPADRPLGD